MIQQLLPNEWSTNFKRVYEFAHVRCVSHNSIVPHLGFEPIRSFRLHFDENENFLKKKFIYISDKIYTIVHVNRPVVLWRSHGINLKGSVIDTYIYIYIYMYI